ncbi:hypothetical protein CJ030_MR1G020569 [Morella rubra]|uniref:Uncharacterized protein n=1 Tax=Morella rubra TaxID=262757 RepID=A0A6A1WM51_9ROSI|nr:hypothetical protein CJ030_MR1G020569 [Morella rubra]
MRSKPSWLASMHLNTFHTWDGLWTSSLVEFRGLKILSMSWIVFSRSSFDLHLDLERTKLEHEDIVDVLPRIEREQTESSATRFTKENIKAILLVSSEFSFLIPVY